MLIKVNNVAMSTSIKDLFSEVSFVINEGEHFGLVGRNGCGKSTLLRILLGQQKPETGTINRSSGLLINYMPQLITEEMAAESLCQLAEAYTYDNLNHQYYDEVMTSLDLWRLLEQEKPILSGGQKTKVVLAATLVFSADLLILDEPTNFIDLPSIIWLENFLRKTECALLTVSHDRAYLDNVVDAILQLNLHGVKYYEGGYSDYVEATEHEAERYDEMYAAQKNFRERLEGDILRTKQQAKNTENATHDDHVRRLAKKVAKKAKARERRLEKKIASDSWLLKPEIRPQVNVQLDSNFKRGTLVRIEDMAFSYDPNTTFLEEINLYISAGEKVALVGKNGCGKSTLLKLIVKILEPNSGKIWTNDGAVMAYFSQDRDDVNQSMTVLQSTRHDLSVSEEEARRVLAGLLIKQDQMKQKVISLSQGEKTKIAIARQILKKPDLLVLDEFTSHLDLDSIEQIQDAIDDYQGAVLFVTHDRYLLETLAIDRFYAIEDGRIKVLLGGLQDYSTMV